MVSFKLVSSTLAAVASFSGLAQAEENWGSFSGSVSSVKHLEDKKYSLVSELVISLNQGWTLADLQGRTAGQIAEKTIAYNTADSKYYSKIGYTASSTNVTDAQVCFEPVPIQISLNEKVNNAEQGRVVNGYFFIGCVDKSRIQGDAVPTVVVAPSANTTTTVVVPSHNATATIPQVNGAAAKSAGIFVAVGAVAMAIIA